MGRADHTPAAQARNERLRECVEVMRALWAGETVTREGPVNVRAAKLYVRRSTRPPRACVAEVCEAVRCSASVERHVEWLARHAELGFERIFLHCVHRDQPRFIEIFGEKVLPALR